MNKILFLFFSFIIFIFPVHSEENQNKKLDELFDQLKNSENLSTAKKIENKIWKLWITHPSDQILTDLLAEGSSYLSDNQLDNAHEVFTRVIELDPNWAEGWNKRATVSYLMGNYKLSQNDIDKVLSLEKRHFGALSGQGLVQSALKNYEMAINSYIEAHRIYPAMESAIIMIEKLQKLIKNKTI
tara:strand:+ start:324 stop:878 length:555 start_codon:yes stop_codon:yes gene_type:complete